MTMHSLECTLELIQGIDVSIELPNLVICLHSWQMLVERKEG